MLKGKCFGIKVAKVANLVVQVIYPSLPQIILEIKLKQKESGGRPVITSLEVSFENFSKFLRKKEKKNSNAGTIELSLKHFHEKA